MSYFVLCVLLMFQVISLIREYDRPLLNIFSTASRSGLWRSVFFHENERLANYVEFLNEKIPTDGKVMIPPNNFSSNFLSRTSHMQFFLYPREVHNCSGTYSTCVSGFEDTSWYILVLDKNVFSTSNSLVMFDEEIGLSVPEAHKVNAIVSPIDDRVWVYVVLSVVLPVIFLGGLLSLGTIFVHQVFPELSALYKLSLGFGLGIGLFSLILFIELLISKVLSTSIILIAYCAIALITLGIYKYYKEPLPKPRVIIASIKRLDFWLLLILGLFGTATVISIGRGYSIVDELFVWGPKGYGIAARGLTEGATSYGTLTTQYPLNIPLSIATFRYLFDETLPQSKLIFPFYYLSTLIMLYEIIKNKVSKNFAGLATTLFGTTQIIFNHATIAYTNLPAMYYFSAAVFLLVEKISKGDPSPQKGKFFLAGILMSLAMWTRPEVIQIGWSVIIVLGIYFYINRSPEISTKGFVYFIAPIIIFTLFWFLTAPYAYFHGGFSEGTVIFALENIFLGTFHFSEAKYLLSFFLKAIFNFKIWGGVGWIFTVLIVFFAFKNIRKFINIPIITGVVYILLIIGSYYFTSFGNTASLDLSWWVSTGLNRMIMPGMILLWTGLITNFDQNSVSRDKYEQ